MHAQQQLSIVFAYNANHFVACLLCLLHHPSQQTKIIIFPTLHHGLWTLWHE